MGKGSSKGHTPREAKDNLKSTQLLSAERSPHNFPKT
ncbi:hypothetical protein AI2852V1_2200 [Escherichia coli]|nr:hypothetical protein AI2852V1_2200 [Escherichia coli]CAF2520818.1 hypothetical protein AI2853V1_2194 [Escherichia coli]CAH5268098.1 hypothetical protein AI2852V1_2200 [Escherichia coli]CAH5302663.1 hypothetical protein AI2853V1_2194 [Escherichia coli]